MNNCTECLVSVGIPKPAIDGHVKTGHEEDGRGMTKEG
jgi:hypothetical protein